MADHVVGVVDDAPVEEKPVSYYVKNEKNRLAGYRIWFRVRVEGCSLLTAWKEVFPHSRAAPRSVSVQCSRFLAWYEETYPPDFHKAANALGLTPYRLMRKFNELLDLKRWSWDEEVKGRVETDEPQGSIQLGTLKELLKLVNKSEIWRRQFIGMDQERPTDLVTTPQFDTVPEFEEWARKQDVLKRIENQRKAATEARDRRLAEEGRLPMPTRPPTPNEPPARHPD